MTDYDQWHAEKMEDREFREAYEALEPADQIFYLRRRRGITQAELAERTGSSQPSIARVEAGGTVPTIDLLRRIAKALDARLVIRLVPREEIVEPAGPAGASAPAQASGTNRESPG